MRQLIRVVLLVIFVCALLGVYLGLFGMLYNVIKATSLPVPDFKTCSLIAMVSTAVIILYLR